MKNTKIRSAIHSTLSGYGVSDEDASNLFQKTLNPVYQPRRILRRKVFTAILCVLLLATLLTTAVGYPDLKVSQKTTDGILAYQVDMNLPMPGVFVAEPPSQDAATVWGQDAADALVHFNAAIRLPEWKPERFTTLFDVDIRSDEFFGTTMDLTFKAVDDGELCLSVRVFPEAGSYGMTVHIQHDNTESESWTYNNIKYSYLSNYGNHSLNWLENNCQVQIYGDISRDECLKMVKSIYK